MPASAFDIFQTQGGYVAVTNPVRRQILAALAEGERELADLVAVTGRAKPTLSSVHLKDLIDQGLVEAVPNRADNRRKSFRLAARRIGSSDVPVESLRAAVKQYVEASPLAARFPLAVSFAAIAAVPDETPNEVLRGQARRLGAETGRLFPATARGDLLMGLARFLEQERLAKPLRLDLEAGSVEVSFLEALPGDAPAERLAALLAGFVEGVVAGRGVASAVKAVPARGVRGCVLHLLR